MKRLTTLLILCASISVHAAEHIKLDPWAMIPTVERGLEAGRRTAIYLGMGQWENIVRTADGKLHRYNSEDLTYQDDLYAEAEKVFAETYELKLAVDLGDHWRLLEDLCHQAGQPSYSLYLLRGALSNEELHQLTRYEHDGVHYYVDFDQMQQHREDDPRRTRALIWVRVS